MANAILACILLALQLRGPAFGRLAMHLRATLLALAVVLPAGCTAVQIGEPYDQVVDSELNAYQKAATQFIVSSQQSPTAGQFSSDQSKAFYAGAAATLSNLQIRADLLSNRQCPTTRVAQIAGALGASTTESAIATAESGLGGPLEEALDVSGNCVAITVRGVVMAHANLEADHREIGRLSPGVAQLNLLAIDSAVRVALRAVRAKDY